MHGPLLTAVGAPHLQPLLGALWRLRDGSLEGSCMLAASQGIDELQRSRLQGHVWLSLGSRSLCNNSMSGTTGL